MVQILVVMTNSMGYTGVSSMVMNYYSFIDKSDLRIDFIVPNQVEKRFKNQIEDNGGVIFELFWKEKNPILYFIKLLGIMRSGNYDIVHAHGNSCTLLTELYAAKLAGIRIRMAHSHNTTCSHKVLHKFLRPFFKRSYTHGFACSIAAGKWLFNDNKFTVIPNGVDSQKFGFNDQIREKHRERYHLQNKKVIGHVGTFNYQKNHEFLIDIFYELTKLDPEYVLVLIGDGDLRTNVLKKTADLGIEDKVISLGKTLDVSELLQAMDIMVLPSRFEGLPVVLIEWQCAGLPSIVSDKVTKEAKLTELVAFMPLETDAAEWANEIHRIEVIDRDVSKETIVDEIRQAGYDIRENAEKLKFIYEDLAIGKGRKDERKSNLC